MTLLGTEGEIIISQLNRLEKLKIMFGALRRIEMDAFNRDALLIGNKLPTL